MLIAAGCLAQRYHDEIKEQIPEVDILIGTMAIDHIADAISEAEKLVKETNRRRAYYYEAFTGLTWDDPENYDFCLNTDYLGFDGTLELIGKLIEKKQAMLGK